jgi:hypothetical protein
MLAGTLVYVNAGTQLAQIDSLAGILSPGLLPPSPCSASFRSIANAGSSRRSVRAGASTRAGRSRPASTATWW